MTMLKIEGVKRSFGGLPVLKGLDLSVPEGQVVSILGPSGYGKSTLLSLVAGMDQPDDGQISLGGRLLFGPGVNVPSERRGINMVFQDYALWPHMKVAAIVGYGLVCQGLARAEREARVARVLDMLQIGHLAARHPGQLSGGQQQRVAMARALCTKPKLLLLDEPLSNLDVQLRQEMRDELATLFGQMRTTALYVTHDPLEASALGDQVIVLRSGRIEQQGPPEAVFSTPHSPWVARLAGNDTTLDGVVLGPETEPGVYGVRIGQALLRAVFPGAKPARDAKVTIMLHPASARLVGADQPSAAGNNQLSGRIDRQFCEGRLWRISVTLDCGARISLQNRTRGTPGTPVTVEFPVTETLAYLAEGA